MNEHNFKQQYLCEPVKDKEYEMYLKLWIKYRKLTRNMPQSMSREAFRIHKEIFLGLPKNEKYQMAKMASLETHV